MVSISHMPLDVQKGIQEVVTEDGGAVSVFLGTTRNTSDSRSVVGLEYEAYEPMALAVMEQQALEAKRRWPLLRVKVVHRVGSVPLGEPSVLVAVSAPHRAEAFDACRWLIDRLKQEVPIWKREHFADGTKSWVLPPELSVHKPEEA